MQYNKKENIPYDAFEGVNIVNEPAHMQNRQIKNKSK